MFTVNDRVLESRELEGYATYVTDSQLVEGRTYFRVYGLDKDGHIPQLDALVFIGPDRAKGDAGLLYFQDAESYLAGVRFDSETRTMRSSTESIGKRRSFKTSNTPSTACGALTEGTAECAVQPRASVASSPF